MAFCRAMRASHHSACAAVASAGQSSPASRGISHSSHCLAEGGVEPGAERLQGLLPRLPDHVDLGIVGDGFQGDVGHALVDEALADVAAGGRLRRRALRDLGFLALPLGAVGEQIPGIARAHDARSRQRERHAGGVDGDPAPAPLLGDVAVVPEPQVGSSTRSPGSVVIRCSVELRGFQSERHTPFRHQNPIGAYRPRCPNRFGRDSLRRVITNPKVRFPNT